MKNRVGSLTVPVPLLLRPRRSRTVPFGTGSIRSTALCRALSDSGSISPISGTSHRHRLRRPTTNTRMSVCKPGEMSAALMWCTRSPRLTPSSTRVGRSTRSVLLTEANRHARDPQVEERLVMLRHTAFDALEHHRPVNLPAAITATGGAGAPLRGVPVAELTPEALRAGLAQHGCVWVRGLIAPSRAEHLARGVDRALDGFDASESGAPTSTTSPWYAPFSPEPGRYRVGGRRSWVRAQWRGVDRRLPPHALRAL